jgi:hypothetical protein
MGRDSSLDRTEEEESTMNQEYMDGRAQGYREALWEVKEILTCLDDDGARRKALSEVNALLADAMSE